MRKDTEHSRAEELPEGMIEGRNAVTEAIRSGRTINKVFLADGDTDRALGRLAAMAKDAGAVVVRIDRRKLNEMSPTGAHQGIIASVAAHEYATIDELLAAAESRGEAPLLVVCDELSDPHNLGAIIRTANAAGADGVIISKHSSASLTPVCEKSSAGAVEYTPVAKVTNLVQTIEKLKKQNIWVIGADMDGENTIYTQDFSGDIAIVIGSEGEGISPLIKKSCDFLVKIPMYGEVTSLNASVAGALMIYEAVRRRQNI